MPTDRDGRRSWRMENVQGTDEDGFSWMSTYFLPDRLILTKERVKKTSYDKAPYLSFLIAIKFSQVPSIFSTPPKCSEYIFQSRRAWYHRVVIGEKYWYSQRTKMIWHSFIYIFLLNLIFFLFLLLFLKKSHNHLGFPHRNSAWHFNIQKHLHMRRNYCTISMI